MTAPYTPDWSEPPDPPVHTAHTPLGTVDAVRLSDTWVMWWFVTGFGTQHYTRMAEGETFAEWWMNFMITMDSES